MKAIILAGENDNLKPLTFTKPKPLLPLINKPIIEHIVDYLQSHFVYNIAIVTNDLREQMMEYFAEKQYVNLSYPEETEPLGSAIPVKYVTYLDETFVVVQGDIITDIDLSEIVRLHKKSGGLVTIVLSPVKDTQNLAIADIEGNGRIIKFDDKITGESFSNFTNTGIYVIESEAMDYIPDGHFDFSQDLFSMVIEKGDISGYITDGFWVDIRRSKDYVRATRWMMGHVRNRISSIICGETFENVVLGENVEVGESIIMGPAVIGDDVIIEDNCFIGPYTCIGDGVCIDENTEIYSSTLFEDVSVGKRSRIVGSFVGEYTTIGDGAKINDATIGGYCKLERSVGIANGSNIWPFTSLPHSSIVHATIKRFERASENGGFFRILSDEEAFYFNMREGRNIVSTGFVANGIEEFVAILRKVDQRSIDYHLRENFNDLAQWIRYVFRDEELADEIEKIDENDKKARRKLIEKVSSRMMIKHNEAHDKEVIEIESCSA
ncbi:MAG: sugar phosphate nucleotidyltransferase [Halobacteriota archaeon]|nr:sugar phosphate nucleotidyltransferase [Halobacteriota archaeon]